MSERRWAGDRNRGARSRYGHVTGRTHAAPRSAASCPAWRLGPTPTRTGAVSHRSHIYRGLLMPRRNIVSCPPMQRNARSLRSCRRSSWIVSGRWSTRSTPRTSATTSGACVVRHSGVPSCAVPFADPRVVLLLRRRLLPLLLQTRTTTPRPTLLSLLSLHAASAVDDGGRDDFADGHATVSTHLPGGRSSCCGTRPIRCATVPCLALAGGRSVGLARSCCNSVWRVCMRAVLPLTRIRACVR